MSTYIYDIDGTLVKYHTNDWLPGALESLIQHKINGHRIILITMRDHIRDFGKEWSPQRTEETILKDLRENGISYDILYNVPSPRVIYDDSDVSAIKRKQNERWVL